MQGCFDALFVWIPAIVCASVIERMYNWSLFVCRIVCDIEGFSCYWKNVRLKLKTFSCICLPFFRFSCYWKNVRLKRPKTSGTTTLKRVSVVIERMYDWSGSWHDCCRRVREVSVVIERMYDWSANSSPHWSANVCFSCYWKNVRLKHWPPPQSKSILIVSVVIERMYDWSSETNWLKINDFWQLVSGLFFENGRSAQKVPLFSKIWGDCLTVFDSCGNI